MEEFRDWKVWRSAPLRAAMKTCSVTDRQARSASHLSRVTAGRIGNGALQTLVDQRLLLLRIGARPGKDGWKGDGSRNTTHELIALCSYVYRTAHEL